jgi:hypothetical protein
MLRHSTSLLDIDPDLGDALRPDEFEEVRRRAVAHVLELEGTRWNPSDIASDVEPGWIGLFLMDGLLLRRVSVAGRMACEILGVGDVFRPWDEDREYAPLVVTIDWLVLKPARVAFLDRDFALRVARWPSVVGKLMERSAGRARHLALTQAVTHLPRTHARLLLLFWVLAERWGTVSPEGVLVRLPLTHQVLAMLVGSHRPTVTIALQRLARSELLIRQSSQRWLLTSQALEYLQDPRNLSQIGSEDEPAVNEARAEADELEALAELDSID